MTCSKGHLLAVGAHKEWNGMRGAIKPNAEISCEWVRGGVMKMMAMMIRV